VKKVTHSVKSISVKSIRNLFKPKSQEGVQPQADASAIYPNYGYPPHAPSQKESSPRDKFVESSVGHEDPLHFYGPPPEPPNWSRAGVRKGVRIDQQHQQSIRQAEEARHLDQQRYEQQLFEQQRVEQQRYEQQLLEQQRLERQRIHQQPRAADIVAQPDRRPKRAIKASECPNPKPMVQRAAALPGSQASESQTSESRALKSQAAESQTPESRFIEPQAIAYDVQENSDTNRSGSFFTAASTKFANLWQAVLRFLPKDEFVRFLSKSSSPRIQHGILMVRDGAIRLWDSIAWSSRRVRGGIALAAILLLLGGWMQFSGSPAAAEKPENSATVASAVDEDLAIRSAGSQPVAAQNSVTDGLAILARPTANTATVGLDVASGQVANTNTASSNTSSSNDAVSDNIASDSKGTTAQTVAQAIAAAPTAAPTVVPPTATATQTSTPQPTFTPAPTATPTPIPTEEIPDEIPAVNIIGSFFADLEASKEGGENGVSREVAQVQRTATPTITPTPLPLSPGRLWSTFVPGPPAQTDHFWIGRPFFSSAKTQIASSNYQFGSTASSRYRVHYGVDISNPMGTDVRAATTGEVIHAGPDDPILLGPYNNFYGNAVVIRLDQRLPVAGGELDVFLLYGHLNQLNVQVGDRVEPDDIVGFVGMKGIALGPHLHVEVRLGANTYNHIVNPYVWMEPIAGTGAIAVRLLTADGRTWRSARVSLLRYENGAAVWSRYIETYSDDGYLGPDPAWGENGAMGSLRPGTYQVVSVLNGERVKAEVQVRAGETTFVELRSKQ